MSTCNMCFSEEIRQIFSPGPLLSGGMRDHSLDAKCTV